METVIHKAEDRGKGDYGWLTTRYSFSFADWYEPARMGFGALRVLNDDVVAPASGFPMHGHRDMEIITLVTRGTLTHKDSMENVGTTPAGDVQVMSAGTGVTHSEYNASAGDDLALFQIWIETAAPGAPPRYEQKSFPKMDEPGMTLLVAPLNSGEGLGIRQNAYIYRGMADAENPLSYDIHGKGSGVYIFVIDGEAKLGEVMLHARDGKGIAGIERVVVESPSRTSFFLIEVPM